MSLRALEVALEAIRLLRPLIPKIQRHDKGLAKQLREAASSMALNLGEGEYSDPGTRRARYFNGMASAGESLTALRTAEAWGYVGHNDFERPAERLDSVKAMLWPLTRGR